MKPKLILCLALVLSGKCRAAIVYPKAPDGGRQMVSKNLDPDSDAKFLGITHIEDLTVADPCESYYVELTNLASGKFLSAAKRNGYWTYPLLHGTKAVGAAGLSADDKTGKTLEFDSLEQSSFAGETLEALRMAEQWPQTKKQDYEVRRLDMPWILFRAVWLHGKSDDIIIPLGATFGRWNAMQPYSESEMLKLLQPDAKKKL